MTMGGSNCDYCTAKIQEATFHYQSSQLSVGFRGTNYFEKLWRSVIEEQDEQYPPE